MLIVTLFVDINQGGAVAMLREMLQPGTYRRFTPLLLALLSVNCGGGDGGGTGGSSAAEPRAFEDYYPFAGGDMGSNIELWRSDGTEAGTRLVKAIGINGSSPDEQNWIAVNGKLVFTADDDEHGRELWQSDGTEAGTAMIKDINPFDLTGVPGSPMTQYNGNVFFAANDGQNGLELWVSDLTESGTRMVKDINPQGSSAPGDWMVLENGVLFSALGSETARQLWISDGTESGTRVLFNSNQSGPLNPKSVYRLGANGLFTADGVVPGGDLWATDGTSSGTVLVKVLSDVISNPYLQTSDLPPAIIDSNLYFTVNDGVVGREPWITDGTSSGTRLLNDVNSQGDALSSTPAVYMPYNGEMYFFAWDGDVNNLSMYLWHVEETVNGTTVTPIKQIEVCVSCGYVNFAGKLYFTANAGVNGFELWSSDGTGAGTTLLKDINTTAGVGSTPQEFAVFGGKLLFKANDGVHGYEMWQSDGSESGTALLIDLNAGPGHGMVVD